MGKGWTAADINRAVGREGRKRQEAPVLPPPRPPDPPPAMQTPPTPPEARSGQIPKATPEQQRPARLRPVCQTATHPGFEGIRMVLHGLTPEQHRAVTEAAAGAGIHVIQNGTNHV